MTTLALGRLSLNFALLAAANASDDPASASPVAIGVGVAICVAAVVAFVVVRRMRQAAQKNSHSGLFGELCRWHKLDRAQRALLKQLTQQQKVAQMARVFTEPQWLQKAQGSAAFRAQTKELAALYRLLFEAPAEAS
jgi:hypothetical protein